MFEMRGPVQHKLGLVLRVASKFAPEVVNKSSAVSKVLLKEILKFKPRHKN